MKKLDKTYYQILGLSLTASTGDIKRAYRKIAKAQHPDLGHQQKTEAERAFLTEQMLRINEAYETLLDRGKRAAYDAAIGVSAAVKKPFKFASNTEDEAREFFLARVFTPSRSDITRVLKKYKNQIRQLSLDPFDDKLLEEFQTYLDEVEATLRNSSKLLSSQPEPASLVPAVMSMRHCIAQAADGLEELHHFCRNYNYDHLSYAESLFRIAHDLAQTAFEQTKMA